ncbi:LPXTG cell wall anchor domain-containing protein [Streptomyces sp. NPDC126499]|uniref:LPXTG cell wall anchor domain-containing protein n=1 Tax=Streptomyces sp. NPDC126499 TaxID=3155314 RepID=UPI0033247053
MRRTLISAATVVSTVTAASLLLAPVASATGKPKGDNGTVKIHDSKTGEELKHNEPKVCSFYVDAFGFDAGQKVQWHIEAWANNEQEKGDTVKEGTLVLDADGHERTADMTLPNGQYKLFWNFEGENGRAKQKVFKTDCPPGEENPGKPTDKPSGKPSDKPSGTPSTTPSGTPGTETPGSSESPSPSASASTPAGGATTAPGAGGNGGNGGAEGDLAETGSSAPVGILAAVAVALAGAGAFLVSRRRKAQQH